MIKRLFSAFNLIVLKWHQWTLPVSNLGNFEDRRQAQLLASILLGALLLPLPLTTLFDLLGVYGTVDPVKLLVDVATIIVVLVLFHFAKRGHYRTSAYSFILTSFVLVFIFSAITPEDGKIRILYYGLLIAFVSNLFLSFNSVLFALILQMSGMVIFALLSPDVNLYEVMIGPFLFNLLMIGIIAVVIYHRDQIEKLRQRRLVASEERYRRTSELISDYAFAYNIMPDEGHELSWSTGDTYATITGYTAEERDQLPAFALYHNEDKNRAREDLMRVISGETVSSEYRINTKSGDTRWIEVTRKPIWDERAKRVVQFYGVVRDVTTRKRAEEHKLQMELEKQRSALLAELVLAISHDFRTSVATIETSRYIVEHRLPADARELVQPKLNIIRECIDHLTEQLDNLRTVHSLSELNLEPTNINDLAGYTLTQHQGQAKQKQVLLESDFSLNLPKVAIDQQEFKVALDNLIKNALHHTPPEGVVILRTGRLEDVIQVDIQDTGKGIEPEKLPHIFDLFYRGDSARQLTSGGVGLGLTIVKMIVDAHKGKILVHSTPTQGSTFSIQLPLPIDEHLVSIP